MDSFSVLSLTSFCTNISHAAISASVDLSSLTHNLPIGLRAERLSARLLSFSATLEQYGHTTAQLEDRLERRGVVISPALRSKLATWLGTCQGSMAQLNKQLSRLDPETVMGLDWDYLVLQRDLLVAYMQLFLYFEGLLCIEEADRQDSMLDSSDARRIISQVEDTLRCSSKVPPDILPGDGSNEAQTEVAGTVYPNSMDTDEPPPSYEAAIQTTDPVSSQNRTPDANPAPPSATTTTTNTETPPSTSSVSPLDFTSLDLSSLKHGLRAMTSRLGWFRPDPLAGALCEASRRGDVQQITGLLQQGGNVDGRDEGGRSPLGCAIAADQIAAVRLLLSVGADVQSVSCGGGGSPKWPPLFVAAYAGSLGVARLLMEKGARPIEASITGQPYFYDLVHHVCAGDRSKSGPSLGGIRFLLERGANPEASSLSGRRAIIAAAKKGRTDIMKLLLNHGADPKSNDYTGNSILSIALDQANSVEMAELVLQRGGDPNATSTNGDPVLSGAVSKRNVPFARLLLAAGARADGTDYAGQPIIANVVRDAKLQDADKNELVRLLLERGASAQAKDLSWSTAVLHHAIDRASPEVVSLLMQYGADASGNHRKGDEPLLFAALQSGRPGMAEALLRGGASADVVDSKGNSAMMGALIKQDLELVRLLRRYQANVDVGSREFAMALGRADYLEALGLTPQGGAVVDGK